MDGDKVNDEDDDDSSVSPCVPAVSTEHLKALLAAYPNLKDFCGLWTVNEAHADVLSSCEFPLIRRFSLFPPPVSVISDAIRLEKVVAAFADSLTKLELHYPLTVSQACFEAISTCVNLRQLTVACTSATASACATACNALPNLVKLILGSDDAADGDDWFVQMLSACDQLLECDARNCYGISTRAALRTLQACPWLNAFYTEFWDYTRHFKSADKGHSHEHEGNVALAIHIGLLTSTELQELLVGCPSDITSLCLLKLVNVSNVPAQLIVRRFGHQLLSLELQNRRIAPMKRQREGAAALCTQTLISLISQCPALRILTVRGGGAGVGDAVLHAIVDSCPQLQHLSLAGFSMITDAGVEYLTIYMNQLLSVSLLYNPQLTGGCLEMIGTYCPLIESVLLGGYQMKKLSFRDDMLRSLSVFRHPISIDVMRPS